MAETSPPIADPPWLYALALGSNRRHGRHGVPRRVIAAAIAAIQARGVEIFAVSPVIGSAAEGPSRRQYANAAMLAATNASPPALLRILKTIERDFGRRRGQRWGARVLDLDIILWSGGCWQDRQLTIPHPVWQTRDFVARPLATVAGDWRVPGSGLSVRHVAARLARGAARR